MKFNYVAFDKAGREQTGSLDASDMADVSDVLRRQGLFTSHVYPAPGINPGQVKKQFGKVGTGRRLKNMVPFTRQLAVLVSSGTPLVQAISALERQSKDSRFAAVISDVRSRLEEGASFSEAMEHHKGYFDSICRSLVAAGEAGGKLDAMLDRLSKLVRKQSHVRSSIRGAMVYPIVLICISFSVLLVMLLFVLPRFTGLFDTLGAPLPPTTKLIMGFSSLLRSYWWAFLAGGIGSVWGLKRWLGSEMGKRVCDRLFVRLPIFGPIVRSFATARVIRLLGVQIDSHVPLMEALKLTRQSAGNLLYAELVARAEDAATQGQPISTAFADTPLIQPAVYEAIKSGEQTGQLASLMLSIADFLDEENEVVVRSLTSILEPMILILLGAVVGFVAVSMFLPLFDLSTAAGGG